MERTNGAAARERSEKSMGKRIRSNLDMIVTPCRLEYKHSQSACQRAGQLSSDSRLPQHFQKLGARSHVDRLRHELSLTAVDVGLGNSLHPEEFIHLTPLVEHYRIAYVPFLEELAHLRFVLV